MIGIALMGAGRMARVHAKAIGAAGGRLVTVYDVVEQAAKSLAADAGASVALFGWEKPSNSEQTLKRPGMADESVLRNRGTIALITGAKKLMLPLDPPIIDELKKG